jgi:hypothetical protein
MAVSGTLFLSQLIRCLCPCPSRFRCTWRHDFHALVALLSQFSFPLLISSSPSVSSCPSSLFLFIERRPLVAVCRGCHCSIDRRHVRVRATADGTQPSGCQRGSHATGHRIRLGADNLWDLLLGDCAAHLPVLRLVHSGFLHGMTASPLFLFLSQSIYLYISPPFHFWRKKERKK